jgi:hypothetical protein
MHSFTAKNGAVFNFNPDMSGKVTITARNGREICVDGADLMEFADMLRRDLSRLLREEAAKELATHPCEVCGKPAAYWFRNVYTEPGPTPLHSYVGGGAARFRCEEHRA